MKTGLASIFLLLLISCGNDPVSDKGKNTTDTIFLKQPVADSFYSIFYIEKNRESDHYKFLADFSFNQYENLDEYNKALLEKNIHVKKFDTYGLPVEWVPLNLYKGKYYLYVPSDAGNLGRRILNDSLLIFWFMDGPSPNVLSSVKKINETTYTIHSMNKLFDGEGYVNPEILNIYIIDKINKIAVWEYKSKKEKTFNYSLYIPKENIKNYDLIVSYCDTGKQSEFEFDQPDFASLLHKKP
jgi:hypothetical protein